MLESIKADYMGFRQGVLDAGWPPMVVALMLVGGAAITVNVVNLPYMKAVISWQVGMNLHAIDVVQVFYDLGVNAILYTFYMAHTTAPGSPPPGWTADGAPKCTKCGGKDKPPRTHHCRDCKRCVLLMDHHCPWINNCVGFRNLKIYLQFLLCTSAMLVWTMVIFLYFVLSCTSVPVVSPSDKHCPTVPATTLVLMWCLVGVYTVVAGAVGTLTATQVWRVLTNCTTIEAVQSAKGMALCKSQGREYMHPYDFGYAVNWKVVMGATPVDWLTVAPGAAANTGPFRGGLNFPVREDYWEWVKNQRGDHPTTAMRGSTV